MRLFTVLGNLMFLGPSTQKQMRETSYEDLLQLLYYHSDDFGYLNKNRIKEMYDLEVSVALHVEDFLDFYYWDLTKHRLNHLLEETVGNANC